MKYLGAMAFIYFEGFELVIFFEFVNYEILGLWNLVHKQKIWLNIIFIIDIIKSIHALIKLLYSLILLSYLQIVKVLSTLNDHFPVSLDLVFFHEPFSNDIFGYLILWIFFGPSTIF
jgi:hypothetical protein